MENFDVRMPYNRQSHVSLSIGPFRSVDTRWCRISDDVCGTRNRIRVGGRFLPYDPRDAEGAWSLFVVSFGMVDTRLHWSSRCLLVATVAVEVECKYFVTRSKIIRLIALKSVKP